MTKLTRKERAALIAQERALFRGMKITVRPDLESLNRFEKEINGLVPVPPPAK